MNIEEILVSSRRIVINLMICCLVIIVIGGSNVICQDTKTVKESFSPSYMEISTYKEIPVATDPCAPAQCEWWTQIREAGNNVLRKGDVKSQNKYILLFVEGWEKGYRIPLADRPSQLLVSSGPARSSRDIIPKNGKVELSVEVMADGSVGEVKVVKGLRSDMDQRCIRSQRQNIYLPAVKDHAFVTDRQKATCSFFSRKGV